MQGENLGRIPVQEKEITEEMKSQCYLQFSEQYCTSVNFLVSIIVLGFNKMLTLGGGR